MPFACPRLFFAWRLLPKKREIQHHGSPFKGMTLLPAAQIHQVRVKGRSASIAGYRWKAAGSENPLQLGGPLRMNPTSAPRDIGRFLSPLGWIKVHSDPDPRTLTTQLSAQPNHGWLSEEVSSLLSWVDYWRGRNRE